MAREPKRIFIENENVFFAGGIFYPKDIRNETGASILTCKPNIFMKPIYNRMPVLFQSEIANEYLTAPKDVVFDLCEPLDNFVRMDMKKANI